MHKGDRRTDTRAGNTRRSIARAPGKFKQSCDAAHHSIRKEKASRFLWEILIPATDHHGVPYLVDHHQIWDTRVRVLSGGLTISKPAKGQWLFAGGLLKEETIPCRLLATREEMDDIISMTLEHYSDQRCIMAYKVSDEIIMKYRGTNHASRTPGAVSNLGGTGDDVPMESPDGQLRGELPDAGGRRTFHRGGQTCPGYPGRI
jgi:hypothetical protein